MLNKAVMSAHNVVRRVSRFAARGSLPSLYFHSYDYLRHNARRLEHLASLGLPITGRSVLEVGAGIGDHSHFYIDREIGRAHV